MGLSDFVLPLIRRRRLVLGIVAVAFVVSVVAALVWPKSWRATATLLPPDRRMDNPLFVPGSFEGIGASLRGLTLRQMATPTDIFVAILESRNVTLALVERFDLTEEYDVKSPLKAAKRLQGNTVVSVTGDGTIEISTVARSADRAAELANAYVEELDRVNRTLANREAAMIREFVEAELGDARARLAVAEEALRDFQESHGAIEIGEQARAIIAGAAKLRGDIVAAQVEIGVLRRTRDGSHPDVQRARNYLAELRLRLAEIEGERDTAIEVAAEGETPAADIPPAEAEPPSGDPFPPLSKVPALGLRFGRHLREVKTEEAVVALLTEQYHQARIEERRSMPTVRVLDGAVPPERRYRPRRTALVLLATAGGALASVVLAYALEIADRVRRDPERYAALHRAAAELRQGVDT